MRPVDTDILRLTYVARHGKPPKCGDGCGAEVELLYEHELDRPPTCGDCFERLTVGSGDYREEGA